MSKIKKFLFLFLGLALLAGFNKSASAAEPDLLFGENHDYSVILRGNGESIVYARISLTNNQDSTLTNYSFEIPKLNVDQIVGYQVELPRYCAQYDYTQPVTDEGQRPCLKYQEPDYSSGYYGGENTEYHDLEFTNDGNRYTVNLPKPVEPDKSTSLVLSYTGKGYVDENFGLYKFNFETLKVDSRVKNVNVAVDVDSDYILEGQRSSVNYNTGSETNALAGASLDSANKASLGRTIQLIGTDTGGGIYKNAKNLAAGESFSVKGKYASSAWRLNLAKIIASIVFVGVVIAVVVWLSKRMKAKRNSKPEEPASSSVKAEVPALKKDPGDNNLLNPLFIGIGFASSAVVVIGTYLLSLFINANETGGYSDSDKLGDIIFIIVGLMFYLLAIFGPAIWFAASRKNWRAFVCILFWIFAWLIVFVAIYQWGLKDVFNTSEPEPRNYPYILDDCINC